MKFRLVIIVFLVVVCTALKSKDTYPSTGAGGSSGSDMIGVNQNLGMVIIGDVYYAYSITECKIVEDSPLVLFGKGLTDKGQEFEIKINAKGSLIEVNLSTLDDMPAKSYISVPLTGNKVEFEIINRIILAKVNFIQVGHLELLSGNFRAECQ